MILTESILKLSTGLVFKIYHNLPNQKGLSINDAFQNWLARTKKYTPQNFVNYILSKQELIDEDLICMTEEMYNKFIKKNR